MGHFGRHNVLGVYLYIRPNNPLINTDTQEGLKNFNATFKINTPECPFSMDDLLSVKLLTPYQLSVAKNSLCEKIDALLNRHKFFRFSSDATQPKRNLFWWLIFHFIIVY